MLKYCCTVFRNIKLHIPLSNQVIQVCLSQLYRIQCVIEILLNHAVRTALAAKKSAEKLTAAEASVSTQDAAPNSSLFTKQAFSLTSVDVGYRKTKQEKSWKIYLDGPTKYKWETLVARLSSHPH